MERGPCKSCFISWKVLNGVGMDGVEVNIASFGFSLSCASFGFSLSYLQFACLFLSFSFLFLFFFFFVSGRIECLLQIFWELVLTVPHSSATGKEQK